MKFESPSRGGSFHSKAFNKLLTGLTRCAIMIMEENNEYNMEVAVC